MRISGLLLWVLISNQLMADECNSVSSVAQLNAFNSISASFIQTTRSAKAPEFSIEGSLSLQKPLSLRWETFDPSAQVLILKDDTLLIYDADLEQLTIQAVTGSEVLKTPAAIMLQDYKALAKTYQIDCVVDGNHTAINFHAKNIDNPYLSIAFVLADNQLKSIEIDDRFDQHINLEFKASVLNAIIDPSAFDFVPPAGTDIIENTPGVM